MSRTSTLSAILILPKRSQSLTMPFSMPCLLIVRKIKSASAHNSKSIRYDTSRQTPRTKRLRQHLRLLAEMPRRSKKILRFRSLHRRFNVPLVKHLHFRPPLRSSARPRKIQRLPQLHQQYQYPRIGILNDPTQSLTEQSVGLLLVRAIFQR